MAGEEPLGHANLVGNHQAEDYAHQAGEHGQAAAEGFEAVPHKMEGGCEAHSNEHHAGDGSDPEYQQVGDGPAGILNAGQNEQRDGGRAGQAVNNPHHQRAQ